MTQIVYNLTWVPGPNIKDLKAVYSVDFGADQNWLFNMQGSFDSKSIVPLSLYVNNKLNNVLVTVSCNDGQYVRQVPPFGELTIPIDAYQRINFNGSSGITSIEISDRQEKESIFQRIDSIADIVQTGGGLGTSNGDLVTIDRIGRIQGANASPLAANNTVADLAAGTAWPANPPEQTFSAQSFAIQDSLGRLVSADTGVTTSIWFSTNGGVNFSGSYAGGGVEPGPLIEGAQSYFIARNGVGIWKVNKTTAAVTALAAIPAVQMVAIPKDSSTDTQYTVIRSSAGGFGIHNCTGAVVDSAYVTAGGLFAASWAANEPRFGMRFGNNGYVLVGDITTGGTALQLAIIDPAMATVNVPIRLGSFATVPNAWRGRNCLDPLTIGNGNLIIPNKTGANNASFITIPANGGVMTQTDLGSISNRTAGRVCADGGFVIAWAQAAPPIQFRKYDSTGALVLSVSRAPPALTGFCDLVPIKLSSTRNGFIVIYNDAGILKCFIMDEDLTLVTDVAAPFTIGGNAAAYMVWNTDTEFATVSTGTQPVVVKKDFAKSIIGVDKGNGNVLIKGITNINQTFPGSNTFNQNAAVVVGNRGIVFNQAAQLEGLLP